MKIQKFSELVKLPEFEGMADGKYRLVAAGYVHKTTNGEEYVLVGFRNKPSDPLRKNYIVLPCGGLEDNETFKEAVLRETKEETDVDAMFSGCDMFSNLKDAPYLKEYGETVVVMEKNGRGWIYARDSGIKLTGKAFDMIPLSEPDYTKNDSDLAYPHYNPLNILIRNSNIIMPEERWIIETVAEKEFGYDIDGRIKLDDEDFSGFMKDFILP